MRIGLLRLALLLLPALLAACASGGGVAPQAADTAVTFVVVRHAEKVADGSDDPALSAKGQTRAAALADSLADSPLVAAYASGYRRTRDTARPAARSHGLPVITYDARQDPGVFAAALRQAHPAGTVLVVGHSNTAPAIAAALCGCEVAPMEETEYGRRMIVRIDRRGHAALRVTRAPMAAK